MTGKIWEILITYFFLHFQILGLPEMGQRPKTGAEPQYRGEAPTPGPPPAGPEILVYIYISSSPYMIHAYMLYSHHKGYIQINYFPP